MYWYANFDVSQISDIGQLRTKTLQSIGRNWRQFKTDLTSEYVYGPSKGLSPCEKYGISEDDWKEFKKTREDPTWEEKRIKKQETVKLNKAPHTMARGGYDFVVVREMERKLEERKKEHQNLEKMLLLILHLLLHAIRGGSLVVEQEQGEFHQMLHERLLPRLMSWRRSVHRAASLPMDDMILAKAIGRPEHPGRVRG
ncbi:hypothetical protein OROMI_024105 [Orobanche minor]